MTVMMGDSSGQSGHAQLGGAPGARSPLPSVVMAMMRPPRAFTSCMLETTFAYTSSCGATNTTGISSSNERDGPCFISAAGTFAWM